MTNLPDTSENVGARKCGLFLVIVSVVLDFILQSVGMFTMSWATNTTCTHIGLYMTCCEDECKYEGIDNKILGLEATAYVFLTVILIILMCTIGTTAYKKNHFKQGHCMLFSFIPSMLFIPGMLSFSGCMITVGKSYVLGFSFYINLISSIFLLLTGIVGYGRPKCCEGCTESDSRI